MIRKLLPLLVISVLGGASYFVFSHPPEAPRMAVKRSAAISVEVETVTPEDFPIWVESYGRVQPRTQSELLPQVAGEIVWINPDLRAGGFFEAGDELLRIDDRDYQVALSEARAALASARQTLSEEQAQSEQAKADWKRLGYSGNAPDRVARVPQLQAAKASLASAQAAVTQAELNLERTHIRAPYAGRVLEKSVDRGQVVATGTTLATLYAVDYVEVRLPIQSRDLAYVELPERYRYSDPVTESLPQVSFISDLIGHEAWQGQVVQTEGAIDEDSRQLYVLAQINDPYGSRAEGRVPLKIGQYVQARIQGRTLSNAIVISNRVIYQGSYVYVVAEGVVQRRDIRIGWQDEQQALISEGLQAGDQLVLTTLGQVVSGTPVSIRQPALAEQGKVPQAAAKKAGDPS
ncbi:efflux RND transporter periplasmic adaptor subunit [Neptuniibacter halophilus]|uniref:efflux RND transporter periplasmic adaptor subunit n=1 Tax=Neptuniibacter halophilus TaxID=651666 RepID=UPI0025735ECC|nr:efflux RND transporter periplasmic adaptor subunit [Neptuniibacter halophilus]